MKSNNPFFRLEEREGKLRNVAGVQRSLNIGSISVNDVKNGEIYSVRDINVASISGESQSG